MTASSVDELAAANRLYEDGRFDEAIAAYQQIEPKTAHVFYNLGNAYVKQGKLGQAALSYERARRLDPRDPDILANLRFVQDELDVVEVNGPPGLLQRFFQSILYSRTLNEWSGYELASLWATTLGVGLLLFIPKYRALWLTASACAFLCLVFTSSILASRLADQRNSPKAVVLSKQVEARFAPLADATVHFKAREGTKVAIKEKRGAWRYIERADGQQGWVPAASVEPIGIR